MVAQALAGFPVGLLRQSKSIVPDPPRAAELNNKPLLLFRKAIG
jgi:hypothetical protein